MNLTPRQMLILVVLIVGFGVAAFVVSRDDGASTEIDQALWCDRAGALEGSGPLLRGSTDDVTTEELESLNAVFFDVETIAPFDLWDDIATLADFTIIAKQQLADLEWPDAYAAARENKETRIDAAIDALELELATCGLSLA